MERFEIVYFYRGAYRSKIVEAPDSASAIRKSRIKNIKDMYPVDGNGRRIR